MFDTEEVFRHLTSIFDEPDESDGLTIQKVVLCTENRPWIEPGEMSSTIFPR